jgi:hypothetical protein
MTFWFTNETQQNRSCNKRHQLTLNCTALPNILPNARVFDDKTKWHNTNLILGNTVQIMLSPSLNFSFKWDYFQVHKWNTLQWCLHRRENITCCRCLPAMTIWKDGRISIEIESLSKIARSKSRVWTNPTLKVTLSRFQLSIIFTKVDGHTTYFCRLLTHLHISCLAVNVEH